MMTTPRQAHQLVACPETLSPRNSLMTQIFLDFEAADITSHEMDLERMDGA